MGVIKTYSELYKLMENSLKNALDKSAEEIKQMIEFFIAKYYSEYEPKQYERTFQFLNSCIKTDVKKDGDSYKVVVFIDYINLDYEDIVGYDGVSMANLGYHGRPSIKTKTQFWSDSMEELKQGRFIQEEFAKFLRSQGWNVK